MEFLGVTWTPLTEDGAWLFALVLVGLVAIVGLAKAAPWLFDLER